MSSARKTQIFEIHIPKNTPLIPVCKYAKSTPWELFVFNLECLHSVLSSAGALHSSLKKRSQEMTRNSNCRPANLEEIESTSF